MSTLPTGQLIRRYERARPGELVHVDVKKLGRLRDGGGWRVHGRDSDQSRAARRAPRVGFDHVHIDDHTRLAYAEIHPDETAATCAGFLRRAAGFFAAHGIDHLERVMTDNALAYRRSTPGATPSKGSPAATAPKPTAKPLVARAPPSSRKHADHDAGDLLSAGVSTHRMEKLFETRDRQVVEVPDALAFHRLPEGDLATIWGRRDVGRISNADRTGGTTAKGAP